MGKAFGRAQNFSYLSNWALIHFFFIKNKYASHTKSSVHLISFPKKSLHLAAALCPPTQSSLSCVVFFSATWTTSLPATGMPSIPATHFEIWSPSPYSCLVQILVTDRVRRWKFGSTSYHLSFASFPHLLAMIFFIRCFSILIFLFRVWICVF